MRKLITLLVQGVFITLLTSNPAFSQKSCDNLFNESKTAKTKFEEAKKKGGSSTLTGIYQAHLAAWNRFQSCLSQGGTITPPDLSNTPNKGGSGGTDNGGNPEIIPDSDSDGDGVLDRSDKCPDTAAALAVDVRGCPAEMELTVSTDAVDSEGKPIKGHPPGTTVNIGGTVKNAYGEAIPGVSLVIELEGTGLNTLAGTMQDVAYYRGLIDLPLDIKAGTYAVRVTASKSGYQNVWKSAKITVGGPELSILVRRLANVPIEREVDWNIRVTGGEGGVFQRDVKLTAILTNLDTGESTSYPSLSYATTFGGRKTKSDSEWSFKRKWSEPEAGNWQIELNAFKEGYLAAYSKDSFIVGEHIVELKNLGGDSETIDHFTNCGRDTVIFDHPKWHSAKCFVKGYDSLLHEVRYEWTAEAGFFDHPDYDTPWWNAPQSPGDYEITVRAICTKDSSVSSASHKIQIKAVSNAEWLNNAYFGNIEMRGFDKVKIEKLDGDEDDDYVEAEVKDRTGEFMDAEEGMWLEGDEWFFITGFKAKVTLGVYRKGERVGEVHIGELSNYSIQIIRDSTFGWVDDPMFPKNGNPYSVFYFQRRPYKPVKGPGAIDVNYVSTPAVTASVRGTKFLIALDPDTSMNIIAVLEGEVSVKPLLFEANPKVVTTHQWTTVDEAAFGAIQQMTGQQIQGLAEVFSKAGDDSIMPSSSEPLQKTGTGSHIKGEAQVISADQMGFEDVDVSGSPTSNWDNANWGKAGGMMAAGLPGGESSRRTFMKFNTSKLDLTHTELKRAELEFHTAFGSGLGNIEVYRVLGPWKAGTGVHTEDFEPVAAPGEITWSRQPFLEEGRVWASAEVSPTPGLVRFDITTLLQAWLSGEYPNYGLALVARAQGEEFYYRDFISSDHPDEGMRPRLYIERGLDRPGDRLNTQDIMPKPDEFVTTSSGLKYQDIVQGSGAEAATGKTVTVHYTGWLMNGAKFDSSLDRGAPFKFNLGSGQVIKGWDEGIVNMRIGGKRLLFIPSELAYGERGAGNIIPPNSELKFEVELLDVE